jgi:hypothetical protein
MEEGGGRGLGLRVWGEHSICVVRGGEVCRRVSRTRGERRGGITLGKKRMASSNQDPRHRGFEKGARPVQGKKHSFFVLFLRGKKGEGGGARPEANAHAWHRRCCGTCEWRERERDIVRSRRCVCVRGNKKGEEEKLARWPVGGDHRVVVFCGGGRGGKKGRGKRVCG